MTHLKERLPPAPTKLALGVGMAVALLLGGCGDASSTRVATGWSGDEPRLDDDSSPGASGTAGTNAADGEEAVPGPRKVPVPAALPGPVYPLPNAGPHPAQPQLQNPAQLGMYDAGKIEVRNQNQNPAQLGIYDAGKIEVQNQNQNPAQLGIYDAGKIEVQNQNQNSAQLGIYDAGKIEVQNQNQNPVKLGLSNLASMQIQGSQSQLQSGVDNSASAGTLNANDQKLQLQKSLIQQSIAQQALRNKPADSSGSKSGALGGGGMPSQNSGPAGGVEQILNQSQPSTLPGTGQSQNKSGDGGGMIGLDAGSGVGAMNSKSAPSSANQINNMFGGGAEYSVQGAGGKVAGQIIVGAGPRDGSILRPPASKGRSLPGVSENFAHAELLRARLQNLSADQHAGQIISNNMRVVQQPLVSGGRQSKFQGRKIDRSQSDGDLLEKPPTNGQELLRINGADQKIAVSNLHRNSISSDQKSPLSRGRRQCGVAFSSGQGQVEQFQFGQQSPGDGGKDDPECSVSLVSSNKKSRLLEVTRAHFANGVSSNFLSANFYTAKNGEISRSSKEVEEARVHDPYLFQVDSSEAVSNRGSAVNHSGVGGGSDKGSDDDDSMSGQEHSAELNPVSSPSDHPSREESGTDDDAGAGDQQVAPEVKGISLLLDPEYDFPTIKLKICTGPPSMREPNCTEELRLLVDPSSVGIRVFSRAIEKLGLKPAPVRRHDTSLADLGTCSQVRGAWLWGPVVLGYVKLGDHWTPQKIALQKIGQGGLGQVPHACKRTPEALLKFAVDRGIDGIIGIGPFRLEPAQGDDGMARYYVCHGNSCIPADETLVWPRLANLADAFLQPDNHLAASILHMPGWGDGDKHGLLSLSASITLRKVLKETNATVPFADQSGIEQQLKQALPLRYVGAGKSTWQGDTGIGPSQLADRSLGIFFEEEDIGHGPEEWPAAYYIR